MRDSSSSNQGRRALPGRFLAWAIRPAALGVFAVSTAQAWAARFAGGQQQGEQCTPHFPGAVQAQEAIGGVLAEVECGMAGGVTVGHGVHGP